MRTPDQPSFQQTRHGQTVEGKSFGHEGNLRHCGLESHPRVGPQLLVLALDVSAALITNCCLLSLSLVRRRILCAWV